MNVRRATQADAGVAGSILDEATDYVATLGYDQWPVPSPRDELAQRVERGELFMVEVDGDPAATADVQAAAAGRRYLRLDCMRDNEGIRTHYERLGFEHRGDKDHPRFAAALYERPVRR